MNIMNFFKNRKNKPDEKAQTLYAQLMSPAYQLIYKFCDLDEGMGIAEEIICGTLCASICLKASVSFV